MMLKCPSLLVRYERSYRTPDRRCLHAVCLLDGAAATAARALASTALPPSVRFGTYGGTLRPEQTLVVGCAAGDGG